MWARPQNYTRSVSYPDGPIMRETILNAIDPGTLHNIRFGGTLTPTTTILIELGVGCLIVRFKDFRDNYRYNYHRNSKFYIDDLPEPDYKIKLKEYELDKESDTICYAGFVGLATVNTVCVDFRENLFNVNYKMYSSTVKGAHTYYTKTT